METNKLSDFITQIEGLTNKPEKYLSLQENEAETIKILTKNLYDFTKESENPKIKPKDALDTLIIENLDEEQIWQQVELQNNSVCDRLVSRIATFLAKRETLKFPLKTEAEKQKKKQQQKLESNDAEKKVREEKVILKKKKNVKLPKVKSSVVDDKFFKLYEMENFLEKIEKGQESDGSDDAEIDYFEDDSDSEDEDNKKRLHYNDFFDQPEEENDGSAGGEHNEKKKQKNVKFMLNGNEDGDEGKDEEESDEDAVNDNDNNNLDADNVEDDDVDDDDDDDVDDDDDDNDDDDDKVQSQFNEMKTDEDEEENEEEEEDDETVQQPSTFEARQERLKMRIHNLEEEALSEKPWQLKGEVTASSRPQNSLLEEYVEFDIATRPAPVLTENSTLKLEDVIVQRIKDKAWDDVVRKIKPVDSDIEYKKKLVLDQEKSKLSLAQIYEQEYLKQLDNKNEGVIEKPEVEAAEHQEIRIMMNKLFSKLDALSNFHFTPKQVTADVKIISNLPAINMEEVAPVAASDATLLAPEEVKAKSKGDLIGKSERTATDKKRERRQKKLKQKLKYKQMEAKAKLQLEKSGPKDSQEKKVSQKFLQKLTKSSNVIQLEKSEGGKYVKSSNAFFSKLQDEANSVIKKKNLDLNKMKTGKKFNSKKIRSR